MPNKLTVIIPSRNDENLQACLCAIWQHDPKLSVIVVDDGLLEPPVQAIPGVKPFIFARNMNIGIRAAGESDVILLNDDALLKTPGGFTAMGAYGMSRSLALVAPQSNVRRFAMPYTIPFVCVLIPRLVINGIGMLDERYDCYGGEDDDYCYRVRTVGGGRIGIFDGCVVDHGTLKSTFRPDGKGLPISEAQRIFREIHGFEMATR